VLRADVMISEVVEESYGRRRGLDDGLPEAVVQRLGQDDVWAVSYSKWIPLTFTGSVIVLQFQDSIFASLM